MTLAVIVSVNAGLPQGSPSGPGRSAIHKHPLAGLVRAGRLGLEGDGQADIRHHGGPDRALHAHFLQHLRAWGQERGCPLDPGAIGENLTLAAAPDGPASDEAALCIGDVLRAGTAVLQVSQPRIPCHKQAARIGVPVARIAQSGRCGLYLRVLEEGVVGSGAVLELLERPHPDVTVADAHRFVHGIREPALQARLAACPELGPDLVRRLRV
jgi:MOSC domain-containing protein YiiM